MSISAAELASMQATAHAAMDQSATIKRASLASDGAGGSMPTWSTIGTVACTLSQPTPALMQNYDYLIGPLDSWMVRVPVGTDVRPKDHLIIGTLTLLVQSVPPIRSRQITLTLLASRIEGEAA